MSLGQSAGVLALSVSRFDADPRKVSDILDLEPTFVGRKGEVNPQSGRSYKANLWGLDVHPDPGHGGAEHAAALAAIVALLTGREQHFARLRQELRPERVTLYGGLYFDPNEQCGVWLDPEQMRVLTGCEVGWGLDIFTTD